jgi:hypothetical protein
MEGKVKGLAIIRKGGICWHRLSGSSHSIKRDSIIVMENGKIANGHQQFDLLRVSQELPGHNYE